MKIKTNNNLDNLEYFDDLDHYAYIEYEWDDFDKDKIRELAAKRLTFIDIDEALYLLDEYPEVIDYIWQILVSKDYDNAWENK